MVALNCWNCHVNCCSVNLSVVCLFIWWSVLSDRRLSLQTAGLLVAWWLVCWPISRPSAVGWYIQSVKTSVLDCMVRWALEYLQGRSQASKTIAVASVLNHVLKLMQILSLPLMLWMVNVYCHRFSVHLRIYCFSKLAPLPHCGPEELVSELKSIR